jgi:hypothetical protein
MGKAAWLRLSALLPALLLAACWAGEPFYSKADLRSPIAPGLYRAIEAGSSEEQGRYRVSIRRDGYTMVAKNGRAEPELAGFAPLPGRDGIFVAWLAQSAAKSDDDESVTYGLLERRGSEYKVSFPMCSETRTIAEAAGGIFSADPKIPMCVFRNRAQLEAGLRRVADEGPVESIRLVPVVGGDRD